VSLATHLAPAAGSTLGGLERVRIELVLGEAESSILCGLARAAWQKDLPAALDKGALGVELARALLHDAEVARGRFSAQLKLVHDAVGLKRLHRSAPSRCTGSFEMHQSDRGGASCRILTVSSLSLISLK